MAFHFVLDTLFFFSRSLPVSGCIVHCCFGIAASSFSGFIVVVCCGFLRLFWDGEGVDGKCGV
jgi:hypothetical protein